MNRDGSSRDENAPIDAAEAGSRGPTAPGVPSRGSAADPPTSASPQRNGSPAGGVPLSIVRATTPVPGVKISPASNVAASSRDGRADRYAALRPPATARSARAIISVSRLDRPDAGQRNAHGTWERRLRGRSDSTFLGSRGAQLGAPLPVPTGVGRRMPMRRMGRRHPIRPCPPRGRLALADHLSCAVRVRLRISCW